jgi:hypothetical protein
MVVRADKLYTEYMDHLDVVSAGHNQLWDHNWKARFRPKQYCAIMMVRCAQRTRRRTTMCEVCHFL